MARMMNMPSKPPIVFPQEQRMLAQLGERIRLARLRRQLSSVAVAGRAGISRTTLYKVEVGDAGVTMGTYLRVLAALGLSGDLDAVAADDRVGRRLQDLALESPSGTPRKRAAANSAPRSGSSGKEE